MPYLFRLQFCSGKFWKQSTKGLGFLATISSFLSQLNMLAELSGHATFAAPYRGSEWSDANVVRDKKYRWSIASACMHGLVPYFDRWICFCSIIRVLYSCSHICNPPYHISIINGTRHSRHRLLVTYWSLGNCPISKPLRQSYLYGVYRSTQDCCARGHEVFLHFSWRGHL